MKLGFLIGSFLIIYLCIHNDYRDGVGKFCDAYCCYKDGSSEMYGEIRMLAECLPIGTIAFIKPLQPTSTSILALSGQPCRDVLEFDNAIIIMSMQYII